jgi:hypothetical protein
MVERLSGTYEVLSLILSIIIIVIILILILIYMFLVVSVVTPIIQSSEYHELCFEILVMT